jgi:V/A-type H+-transporting ATPase subunit I
VVEIMEILMGYLANTVSFIRVAAFGLAHAGLFIAVFSLADVVSSKPGGMVLSGIVLVLGNALIIALEGLVVTIQALRLEYYEFFGKFFKGLGSKYEPAGLMGAHPRPRNVKGGE